MSVSDHQIATVLNRHNQEQARRACMGGNGHEGEPLNVELQARMGPSQLLSTVSTPVTVATPAKTFGDYYRYTKTFPKPTYAVNGYQQTDGGSST